MPALWTPPRVRPEHEVGTRQWEALVLSMMHQEGGVLDYWNPELKKIDRNLRLMQATPLAAAPGVLPGFYHLVRLRDPAEGTFMWVQPIFGPDGGFIEPNSAMLDALRASDLQSTAAVGARHLIAENERRSAERAKAKDEEDRLEEGVERFKAATRTQILTSSDVPYSQNNSAAARRARGEKRRGNVPPASD